MHTLPPILAGLAEGGGVDRVTDRADRSGEGRVLPLGLQPARLSFSAVDGILCKEAVSVLPSLLAHLSVDSAGAASFLPWFSAAPKSEAAGAGGP